MKREKVKYSEFIAKGMDKTYLLSKDQALEILKEQGVSEAEKTLTLNRWLKEGMIDSVLIGLGRVEERGWKINKESLYRFIDYKKQTIRQYNEMVDELADLKDQVKQLKAATEKPKTKTSAAGK